MFSILSSIIIAATLGSAMMFQKKSEEKFQKEDYGGIQIEESDGKFILIERVDDINDFRVYDDNGDEEGADEFTVDSLTDFQYLQRYSQTRLRAVVKVNTACNDNPQFEAYSNLIWSDTDPPQVNVVLRLKPSGDFCEDSQIEEREIFIGRGVLSDYEKYQINLSLYHNRDTTFTVNIDDSYQEDDDDEEIDDHSHGNDDHEDHEDED